MADLLQPVLGFVGVIRWLYFVRGPALVTDHLTNFAV
jgi:hypothetical protein